MQTTLIILFFSLAFMSCSSPKKVDSKKRSEYSKIVRLTDGNKVHEATLQLPGEFESRLPVVVIVHEWWGRTERMNEVARDITQAGYAALPVDLYGNGLTVETPREAQGLATPFYKNPRKGVELIEKIIAEVKKDPHVDPEKVVVIGYCFGGTQALNLARSGTTDVAGVVSFHGNLDSSLKAKKGMPKLLVLTGNSDPMVPPAQVKAFKKEMSGVDANLKLIGYPGATHAFTNPNATAKGKKFNIPIAYDATAANKSWAEFLKFMREVEGK